MRAESDIYPKASKLSVKEAEALDYYDFMSYLGVPYYQIGGLASTKKLAELCQIDSTKKVLMVGSGTGFSACYLARKIGCEVVGIDIAALSIEKAKERAKKQGISEKAKFMVGDAYALPFKAGTFDAVITEFVSQFLDRERAFKEFIRVLKPGTYVGINEMCKEKNIPAKAAEEITKAEKIFGEITELPFSLLSPEEWREELEKAGLKNVDVRICKNITYLQETRNMIDAMGGTLSLMEFLIGSILKTVKYFLLSKKIRYRFKKLDEGKRILLRKKSTSQYVGYVLATGRKASEN
jgi:ubiquinone/menaquinone biosynthesis C-methylase UbiE